MVLIVFKAELTIKKHLELLFYIHTYNNSESGRVAFNNDRFVSQMCVTVQRQSAVDVRLSMKVTSSCDEVCTSPSALDTDAK